MVSSKLSSCECSLLSQILINNLLYTSHIMLGLSHVIQSCPPLPLRRSLCDFHTPHKWTEHFDVHFGTDSSDMVPQQYRGIDAALSDRQDGAREWFTTLESCVEYIANLGAL